MSEKPSNDATSESSIGPATTGRLEQEPGGGGGEPQTAEEAQALLQSMLPPGWTAIAYRDEDGRYVVQALPPGAARPE